jgi:hypothetical protein
MLENEPNTAKATAGWGAEEDRAGNDIGVLVNGLVQSRPAEPRLVFSDIM